MGMHESQSDSMRILLAEAKHFGLLYDKLVDTYPENLKNITHDHFIKGINKSEPSLIRTEADELSYPFISSLDMRLKDDICR